MTTDAISLAARLVRAAMWDQAGGEMPTRDELNELCALMREAGIFIRDRYDREKPAAQEWNRHTAGVGHAF